MGRPRTVSEEVVLDATASAIARHGPGGLTLAAVAQNCGLAPATLVQRYGSKRGLLLALAARAPHSVAPLFERAARGRTPLAALHGALAAMAAGAATPEAIANQIGFLQMDLRDPELAVHARDHATATRREIERLLRAAKDEGELRRGADPHVLAEAVQTAYNGALILWAIEGRGSLRARLRRAVDLLLAPHRA